MFHFLLIPLVGLGLGCFDSSFSATFTGLHFSDNKLREDEACPLNFDIVRKLTTKRSKPLVFLDIPTHCHYVLEGFRLVRSAYLQETGLSSSKFIRCVFEFVSAFVLRIPIWTGHRKGLSVSNQSDFWELSEYHYESAIWIPNSPIQIRRNEALL